MDKDKRIIRGAPSRKQIAKQAALMFDKEAPQRAAEWALLKASDNAKHILERLSLLCLLEGKSLDEIKSKLVYRFCDLYEIFDPFTNNIVWTLNTLGKAAGCGELESRSIGDTVLPQFMSRATDKKSARLYVYSVVELGCRTHLYKSKISRFLVDHLNQYGIDRVSERISIDVLSLHLYLNNRRLEDMLHSEVFSYLTNATEVLGIDPRFSQNFCALLENLEKEQRLAMI